MIDVDKILRDIGQKGFGEGSPASMGLQLGASFIPTTSRDGSVKRGGMAASSALQGAGMGAQFGPIGAGVGAVLGGVTGLIQSGKLQREQQRDDKLAKDLEKKNFMQGSRSILASYPRSGVESGGFYKAGGELNPANPPEKRVIPFVARKTMQYAGVPLPARTLMADLMGDTGEINASDLSKDEYKTLQGIVRTNLAKGKNIIEYGDYKSDTVNRYSDVGGEEMGISKMINKLSDPAYKLKTTLGQAGIKIVGNDTLVVDKYDFNDKGKRPASDLLTTDPYKAMRTLGSLYGSGPEDPSANVKINTTQKPRKLPTVYTGKRMGGDIGSDLDRSYMTGGSMTPLASDTSIAKGKTHEQGGINLYDEEMNNFAEIEHDEVVKGTKVYSDTLKVPKYVLDALNYKSKRKR